MPEIKVERIKDKNVCYQKFKDILDTNGPYVPVCLIKTVYLKKQEKKINGKVPADKDKEFLEAAFLTLHDSCSLTYSIREQESLSLFFNTYPNSKKAGNPAFLL